MSGNRDVRAVGESLTVAASISGGSPFHHQVGESDLKALANGTADVVLESGQCS